MGADEGVAQLLGRVQLGREAKVRDLHLATRVQKDVARLHVPMDLVAFAVEVVEAGEHARGDFAQHHL